MQGMAVYRWAKFFGALGRRCFVLGDVARNKHKQKQNERRILCTVPLSNAKNI